METIETIDLIEPAVKVVAIIQPHKSLSALILGTKKPP